MPTNPPERVTHFVEWDARRRRWMRAICGELIHTSDESPRPTCPECHRAIEASLAALDAELAALEARK